MNSSNRFRLAVCAAALLDACGPATVDSSAAYGVEWQLVELNGQPAPRAAGGKPGTLLLSEGEGRASGLAGCNRFAGTFTRSADQIQFGPLAMTKMACAEGMDLEASYSSVLTGSRGLRVTPTGLELLSGSTVVARFTKP